MAVRLSIAIQHHPSRTALLARLRRRLPGAEVIHDPDPSAWPPSPWRTYRRCLAETPPDATHRLVVQDDSIPCIGFADAAERAITAQPGSLICFYTGGAIQAHRLAVVYAQEAGQSWCRLDTSSWVPAVAVSWPAWMIDLCLSDMPDGCDVASSADDAMIGAWCRLQRVPVLATVPSLVEHRDGHRSLVGGPIGNTFRQAVSYIGTDDPSRIDWTLGP